MTDLEITRLCAEAMEMRFPNLHILAADSTIRYDPLHNDVQAMALVKKFGLECSALGGKGGPSAWRVKSFWGTVNAVAKDLNRAICECIAKMQAGK